MFMQVFTPPFTSRGRRATLFFSAALALTACAPSAPRFGNFGGQVAPSTLATPASDDICAVAQPTSICWTPVQARFHPNGEQMVVNLCSNRLGAIYYCRLVEYRWADQRWRLLPGQEEGKSYQFPSYSADGKTLVFGVATCEQPDCKENSGYGQLATMAVQAAAGSDTVYGPLKLLPVAGISRPNFSPDGQQILYWRSHHQSRLASGRNIGSISVFGYKPATDEEANLVPGLHTETAKVHFINALSGPRYSLDGKVIRLTAQDDGFWAKDQQAVRAGVSDIEYNVATGKAVDRKFFGVTEGLGRVFMEHPTLGILAGAGNLRLVTLQSPHSTRAVTLSSKSHQISDADIDRAGLWNMALSGVQATFPRGPVNSPRRDYWLWADEHRGAAKRERTDPVFALIPVQSGEVRAVQWPNVESLMR